MKAISKSNGTRSRQRAARSNAAVRASAKRSNEWIESLEDETNGWDALDAEIDLDSFDPDGIDDADAANGDWLADRDLALEIAQRALH